MPGDHCRQICSGLGFGFFYFVFLFQQSCRVLYKDELKVFQKDHEMMEALGGAQSRVSSEVTPGLRALSGEVWKAFEDGEHTTCYSVFLSSWGRSFIFYLVGPSRVQDVPIMFHHPTLLF